MSAISSANNNASALTTWSGKEPPVNQWQRKKTAFIFTSTATKDPLTHQLSQMSLAGRKEEQKAQVVQDFTIKYLYDYRNAHQDDIHALLRMPNDRFISGSKDGTLHQWTWEGEYVQTIQDCERINYKKWITAIALVDEECWVSGTRDGEVDLWAIDGDLIARVPVKPPKKSHKSKERNLQRVNCLSTSKSKEERSCFIGFPTQFTEYSLEREREISTTSTSSNDWVYCIHPLSDSRLLVVTGAILDIWKKSGSKWSREGNLIREPYPRPAQRPYISSLTPLESHDERFGIAVFDGSVQVINIETKKIEFRCTEHVNRVWTIENLTRNVFASCGDDHCIKLWDVRQSKSTKTISRHVGRVSTLLRLTDHLLVAGTCPKDLKRSKEAAQLVYYDFRYMKE